MKTFLINLDRNRNRLLASEAQLTKLGVGFERVSAVDGRALGDKEKHRLVSYFRWWCARGTVIRDGEIGCAASHNAIYKRMLDEDIPMACVLEDDNRYREDFVVIRDALGRLMDSKQPQVVLLSNCTDDRASSSGAPVQIVPSKGDQWTSAYLITQEAARHILAANSPIKVPCDSWGRWVRSRQINLYHGFPTITVQDGHPLFAYGIPLKNSFLSDIEGPMSSHVRNYSVFKRLLHICKRVIGLSLDKIFSMLGC